MANKTNKTQDQKADLVPVSDPTLTPISEAVEVTADAVTLTTNLTPRAKLAGNPTVKTKAAKPKIGTTNKITKPTFGVVRGVYN